jgi:hypothetical protein
VCIVARTFRYHIDKTGALGAANASGKLHPIVDDYSLHISIVPQNSDATLPATLVLNHSTLGGGQEYQGMSWHHEATTDTITIRLIERNFSFQPCGGNDNLSGPKMSVPSDSSSTSCGVVRSRPSLFVNDSGAFLGHRGLS